MEFVPSDSPPPVEPPSHTLSKPRIIRALYQNLRLLHRSEATFHVLGATGNVYTVILSTTPSCTCPDQTIPCKHILFVFLRVLGVSLDDDCLRMKTLMPIQLNRLLNMPTSPESLAGIHVRERFHELFSSHTRKVHQHLPSVEIEDGVSCPICLQEMESGERVVACGTCRNPLHEECFLMWKRSRERTPARCVICRASWREVQESYLNLAA